MATLYRIRKFQRNRTLLIGGTPITHAPEGTIIDIDRAEVRRDLTKYEGDYETVSGSPGGDGELLEQQLDAHQADTTDVHGIPDTSTLVNDDDVQAAVEAHAAYTTEVHGITDTSALATETDITDAISTHAADTTSVHGIADTSALVLTNDARLTDTRTPTDQSVTNAKVAPSAAIAVTKLAAGTNGQVLTTVSGVPEWAAPTGGEGGDPTMGGDLSGTASNAQIVAGAVGSNEISSAIKDPITSTPGLRSLGSGAQQAAAGDHTHANYATTTALSNHESDTTAVHGIADTSVLVTSSQLATHEADTLGVHGIADTSQIATSDTVSAAVAGHEADTTNVHGIANTANLMVSGTTAGGDLSGTYPNPSIATGAIVNADINAAAAIDESKLNLASDAAAGTPSRRTLGTGATQAAAGNDPRLTDTRTPTDGTVTDAKIASGGLTNAAISTSAAIAESKLNLASDAAAGTASRRTLGTGATQAAAGNHTHAGVYEPAGTVATHEADTTNVHGISNTANLATTSQVPYGTAVFAKQGTLTTGTGTGRFIMPHSATIVGVYATVNTAPTGSTIIVDVNKNGTTIYTGGTGRPTIAAAGNTSSLAAPAVTSAVAADIFTVDIDQVGSTIAGADLTVQILYTRA